MAERKFTKVKDSEFIILGKTELLNENGELTDEVATVVEGTLQGKEQMNMRGGLVGRYSFLRDDGTTFTLLGAKLLDEKMVSISSGTYLRITLLEATERTSTGNEMKTFDVEIGE